MQAFSPADYEGNLQHHDAGLPPTVPMTGLQIAMSREIGGWPVYTIIIGIGQVRCPANLLRLNSDHSLDVERHELPDYPVDGSQLARQSRALCPRRRLFGSYGRMVPDVQTEAFGLRALFPLDLLRIGFLLNWPSIRQFSLGLYP